MISRLLDWNTLTILMGGISTLAIYSFLVRENGFYRFFEHLFIGISTGLGIVLGIKNFLWPKVLTPLLGLDLETYPDGTVSGTYAATRLLYLLPMAFGLLYYFIYSKRHGWLAKLVIGFSLGMSGGVAFEGTFNEILPQIFTSFKPLIVIDPTGLNWAKSLTNLIFVGTLLSVMFYFFFSFRRESKTSGGIALTGRWLLMVCFGAFFGSTVMARMALLVERLQFLIGDWWTALQSIFS